MSVLAMERVIVGLLENDPSHEGTTVKVEEHDGESYQCSLSTPSVFEEELTESFYVEKWPNENGLDGRAIDYIEARFKPAMEALKTKALDARQRPYLEMLLGKSTAKPEPKQ
ncbi:MAG: hypothetical protein ABI609_00200 [Acidobacteriota bacterium]